jgi:23S rRNA pseudouridine1911/1915/1917 synthase
MAPLPDDERIRGEVVVERLLTGEHRILRFQVPKQHAPPVGEAWRLDRYLHALLPTISRTLIQRWCERGSATVDGERREGRHRLRAGERVELLAPLPEREERAEGPARLEVLYRDRWLMALNKPPGQLAHQAGKTMTGTLVNQVMDLLESEGADPREARLVNRIDRDTSGIVLVSLDVVAHARVAKAMEARDLRKEYVAIAEGVPAAAAGSWREPIGEGDPRSIARVVRDDGQSCHTDYAVVEAAGDHAHALLRLRLHTGRQHQIRVHAAHHGHALVGDWVYGRACAELPGQALHSALLELAHPMSHTPVLIEAPLPAAVRELWDRLRAGGRPTPVALSAEQRSKLGLVDAAGVRRPSWLSEEEFERLREESGE